MCNSDIDTGTKLYTLSLLKAPTSVPFSGGEEGAGRHILRILCFHHSIDVEIEDLYKTETGSAAVKWTIELQLERVITPSPALLSRPRPAQVPGILDIGMRPDDNLILIISYS